MFCASRKTPEESTKCFPDCQKSRFAKNSAQKVFGRLLKKAVDSKGKAFGRVPPDAKFFAFIRIRKGDATARWAVASWETLSRGFPMRRLTPHLCNLLSANQFFDTLESTKCFLLRAAVPFGQSPKRHQKRPFSLRPAASTNESPAPHRVRQAAPSALSCRPVHARSNRLPAACFGRALPVDR